MRARLAQPPSICRIDTSRYLWIWMFPPIKVLGPFE